MSSALIIIDLIEELAGEKGRANRCYPELKKRSVVAGVNRATAYARARKIPVIWVRVGFADDYQDIPAHSPLFQHLRQMGALRLRSPGCRWLTELQIDENDRQEVKKAVSAFAGNNLLKWLQQQGCRRLLLAGISSSMAIESSTRQAHDLGFQVVVLEDLCAAATAEAHQQSMDNLQMLSEVTTSSRWMQR